MSTKRSRVITAAAGTLTLAAAVSAVVTFPAASSAASAGAADAYVTSVSQGANEAQIAGASSSRQAILFDHARLVQRQQAAAAAKAAAARAAAKAAAARAAARKAAALKAARAAAARRAAQAQPAQAAAVTTPSGSPQQIAEQMLGQYGWSSSQFACLEPLWEHESGWDVTAENPSSGAYGIPQALPGAAMASAGPDWQTNAATQIRWGLTYIQSRYGSPCGAWAHEEADDWY